MAHVHSSYCKGPKLSTTVLEPQAAAARHGASFFAPKGHRVERAVGKQDGGLDAPAFAEVRYGAPRLRKLPVVKDDKSAHAQQRPQPLQRGGDRRVQVSVDAQQC